MSREVMKMALEALNSGEDAQIGRVVWTEYDSSLVQEAITAIEAALAQPAAVQCVHDWIDARNKYVKSGEFCRLCGSIRSGNVAIEGAVQPEPWTPEDMAHRPGGLAQPEQEDDAVATLTEEGWMWDGDQWQRPAKPDHPEQMARLGWQYVECPACGSEGARAFPKPEQGPCKGKNCGSTNPKLHSAECFDEHESTIFNIKPFGYFEFVLDDGDGYWREIEGGGIEGKPLYTAPPQRQPLTDLEIENLLISWPKDGVAFIDFARAIEAKHNIGDKT